MSVIPLPEQKPEFRRLAARLLAVDVPAPLTEMPLLWLHLLLPADVRRTVLVPADAVVMTDVGELLSIALDGKLAAVFDDCALTFESLFNHNHALFKARVPQPSALSPQPSALGPRPSAPDFRPSALGPQTPALGPQPSDSGPRHSAPGPRPSALGPRPSALGAGPPPPCRR